MVTADRGRPEASRGPLMNAIRDWYTRDYGALRKGNITCFNRTSKAIPTKLPTIYFVMMIHKF